MDSKSLDVCNSLEQNKACWCCCCLDGESELYRSVMQARCYPWKMPKHCFHKMNPQVISSYT